tara:strand:- start:4024 stop:4347 length:324 start_codon:yes stop_codon:yes gene_type:complete
MKITKSRLKQIIKEELISLKEIRIPDDHYADPRDEELGTDPAEEGIPEEELDHLVQDMTPEQKRRFLDKLMQDVGGDPRSRMEEELTKTQKKRKKKLETELEDLEHQ